MKISINQQNITSHIEFDSADLHEFANHLRNLLHTVWEPEQVIEIMPTEEILSEEFSEVRKATYDEGYENGYDDGKSDYQKVYTEGLKEGESQGYDDGYEQGLEDGKEGIEKVYSKGFEEGKVKGYEEGFEEGKAIAHEARELVGGYAERKAAFAKDFEAGRAKDFEAGRAKGFEEGIEVGKAKGYEEGIDEAITFVEGYAEYKAAKGEAYDAEGNLISVTDEEGCKVGQAGRYIEAAFAESYEKGRSEGYKEGRVAGYENGYADANNAKPAETTEHLQDCIREGEANLETSKTIVKKGN